QLLGGPLGGSARRSGGSSGLRQADIGPLADAPLEAGRYSVRVLVGGVTAWPFATHIGADGYFYLPSLPTNDFSRLVITDRQTFAECTIDVQGRSSGSATAVYVDLDECLSEPIDPDEYTIVWVGTSAEGNWNTASNWSPERVPNSADDVLIPSATTKVNLGVGTFAVRSLRSLGTVSLNSATTALTATADVTLNWLQIANATASFQVGGELSVDRLRISSSYTLPAGITALKS